MAGGGRHMIGAKSPLTGGFAGSEAGGYFGAELKRAGWDLIIFEGVSPEPVYLAIKDDQVELRSAEHIWGLETADAERVIRQEMGERRARVSQCGPAGENLVLISNVMHDATRAAGRTGWAPCWLEEAARRGRARIPAPARGRRRQAR
jgi:aldehyde:ferredoxin oxidoreductase